ncbi:hypothetical protein P3X46_004273 [Hevea brasiliensis]|uniref:Late embryogenesis abundant protein LEA-2 subgroup domain-containing protein n=1 Tax=Hevea brasiliensis TaxID=3981 RepID=A0ABQ9MX03_HEVBR|nr:NDR1/HIN1-like protein 10 [Hevea brasiliensis]KAJ9184559.1 hypothetical protein P3X46_004273 [Hevea brasiliensis]
MAEKQANLNGAYYGPAIPPPNTYHRPGRSCGCGCCLLSCLLKIIIAIVVVAGLAVFIFWLVVRPNKVKFHVTEATLSEFDYATNNNTLYYNLSMTISVRNPNKKIGIYYDRIEAKAFYEDQRFGYDSLAPFYQGHKNTSILTPAFEGKQVIPALGGEELTKFNQEKTSGVYSIDVKLYLKIRFKIGKIKVGKFKPKIECDLKVPLSTNGTVAPIETTKCDWDY